MVWSGKKIDQIIFLGPCPPIPLERGGSEYSNVRLSFVDQRWAQLYVSLVPRVVQLFLNNVNSHKNNDRRCMLQCSSFDVEVSQSILCHSFSHAGLYQIQPNNIKDNTSSFMLLARVILKQTWDCLLWSNWCANDVVTVFCLLSIFLPILIGKEISYEHSQTSTTFSGHCEIFTTRKNITPTNIS